MRTSAIGWCLGFVLVAGCGETSISSEPLSGKIGGRAWSFGTGETMSALSDADRLWVNLYPGTFDTCVAFGAPVGVDNMIMMMPRAAGDYDLSLNLNATLYDATGNRNYVATSGRLVIDSVTATTISGGLNASFNGDNAVDGQFQAAICP